MQGYLPLLLGGERLLGAEGEEELRAGLNDVMIASGAIPRLHARVETRRDGAESLGFAQCRVER